MNKSIEFMRNVAQDVLNAAKTCHMAGVHKSLNAFYEVMRKHGIKEGTRTGGGRLIANPEWVMCLELFTASAFYNLRMGLMVEEIPEDLCAYEIEEENDDKEQ